MVAGIPSRAGTVSSMRRSASSYRAVAPSGAVWSTVLNVSGAERVQVPL